jgi:hypothetical protein
MNNNDKIITEAFEANAEIILKELKELFYFSPPSKIREHLIESFFTYLIENSVNGYPRNHLEILEDHYFLYMFLIKMETLLENKLNNVKL